MFSPLRRTAKPVRPFGMEAGARSPGPLTTRRNIMRQYRCGKCEGQKHEDNDGHRVVRYMWLGDGITREEHLCDECFEGVWSSEGQGEADIIAVDGVTVDEGESF